MEYDFADQELIPPPQEPFIGPVAPGQFAEPFVGPPAPHVMTIQNGRMPSYDAYYTPDGRMYGASVPGGFERRAFVNPQGDVESAQAFRPTGPQFQLQQQPMDPMEQLRRAANYGDPRARQEYAEALRQKAMLDRRFTYMDNQRLTRLQNQQSYLDQALQTKQISLPTHQRMSELIKGEVSTLQLMKEVDGSKKREAEEEKMARQNKLAQMLANVDAAERARILAEHIAELPAGYGLMYMGDPDKPMHIKPPTKDTTGFDEIAARRLAEARTFTPKTGDKAETHLKEVETEVERMKLDWLKQNDPNAYAAELARMNKTIRMQPAPWYSSASPGVDPRDKALHEDIQRRLGDLYGQARMQNQRPPTIPQGPPPPPQAQPVPPRVDQQPPQAQSPQAEYDAITSQLAAQGITKVSQIKDPAIRARLEQLRLAGAK